MKDSDDVLLSRLCALLSDGSARPLSALGEHFGVELAAVRRALARLASCGLEIDENARAGVRLARRFVPLDEAALRDHLARLQVAADATVVWSIDSTNSALLRGARSARLPASRLSILAAEFQESGRGRQGQRWHGAPGLSLCVSFARALPRAMGELSGLSLVCGIAVCEVLERHGVAPLLKWPNDLLVDGRKLGGILVEVHPQSERDTVAVIGIGVNIRKDRARDEFLSEHRDALVSTDLESAGARAAIDRGELIAELADALEKRLAHFGRVGFMPFQDEWNRLDAYRDRVVALVDQGAGSAQAIARGVDAQGRLCLDTEHGPRRVVAGEFSLRAL